jgi:hypothetical protein
MRTLLVAALFWSVATAAHADPVELELVGGAGGAVYDSDVLAPVLSARLGQELWGFFTPGVRATGVLGPEGLNNNGDGTSELPDAAGNRGWSVLADLRFHTPGRFQAVLDLGGRVGRLVRARDPARRDPGPHRRRGSGVPGWNRPPRLRGTSDRPRAADRRAHLDGIHVAANAPSSFAAGGSADAGNVLYGAALCGSFTFQFAR